MVVLPTVPLPPSVPPLLTAMVDDGIAPLTLSTPPLIVQLVACEGVPVSVQVDPSILLKVVKP